MISIRDVTVSFGGVIALNQLSIDLEDPVVGIIGPNGAGKTTFLNVFSGFVVPRQGSINAFGQELLAMRPFRRSRWGLRRSFQKEQVVDELSVEDNVQVVLDPLDFTLSERKRHTAAALDYCGISKLRRSPAAGLNALERRMVELARCVAGRPRVILLDEPGAGLALTEVEQLKTVITGMRAFNGATTLLIDHDVDLIQATCPVSMVLNFGALIASGATRDVLTDPKVRAVYLGEEVA